MKEKKAGQPRTSLEKRLIMVDYIDQQKPFPKEIEDYKKKTLKKKSRPNFTELRNKVSGKIGPGKFLHDYIVEITGTTAKSRSNIVFINRKETSFGNRRFRLLLALISRLKKTEDGYISNLELFKKKVFKPKTEEKLTNSNIDHKAVEKLCHEIRTIFRKACNDKRAQIIETKNNCHRLSIPPELIAIENAVLLKKHEDVVIRKISACL